MGVPSLGKILKQCPEAWEEIPDEKLSERFSGQIFLFDAPAMMHRFVNKCDTIENNEHLECFIRLWEHMRTLGIESAFIFDGKQTMAKHDEIVKRVESKQRSMSKAQEKVKNYQKELTELEKKTGDPEPLASPEIDFAAMARMSTLKGLLVEETKKAVRRVLPRYYVELKEMFRKREIPFMTAHYEAEQAGSWLVKNGLANVIVSDDYDCLVCGAPFFFQHFHSTQRPQRLIYLDPLIKHLGFTTHLQFVDYCILAGTDFPGRLPGVGPVNAQRLMKKHGSIDALLASPDGKKFLTPEGATPTTHRVAQRMFLNDAFPLSSGEIPANASHGLLEINHRLQQQEVPKRKSPVKKIVRLSKQPGGEELKVGTKREEPPPDCDHEESPTKNHKRTRLINL